MVPGWVMTERQVNLWLTPEGGRQIDERQCFSERLYPADIARTDKMVLDLYHEAERAVVDRLKRRAGVTGP